MISKEKEQWDLFSVFLLLKMYVFGGKKEILSACKPTTNKQKNKQTADLSHWRLRKVTQHVDKRRHHTGSVGDENLTWMMNEDLLRNLKKKKKKQKGSSKNGQKLSYKN